MFAPPPPLAASWTGFYAGVNAGAAFGGSSGASTVATPLFNAGVAGAPNLQAANDAASTNSFGVSNRVAAILGGQVGYNYQFSTNYVVGIEADAQGLPGAGRTTTLNTAVATPGFPNTVVATTGLSKRQDYIGTVRGRLGYTFTPSLLVYATGGFAYGGVRSSTTTVDNLVPTAGVVSPYFTNGSRSTTLTGYTVGGGLEYLFAPNLSLKAEFLYYDLGSLNYNAGTLTSNAAAAAPFTVDSIRTRVRYNGEIARVGLNYHFNTDPAPVVARY